MWQQLQLPQSGYNILVLHGDVDDESYGLIDKHAIASSGAHYVALGHRHAFAEHKFGKVVGAYSGVLEPRGFDESAQTGFVLIDTDKKSLSFVPQAIRSVQTVTVDVSNIQSDIALQNTLLGATSQVMAHNYLNLVLVGNVSPELNIHNATNALKGRFFALRIDDRTQTAYNLDELAKEYEGKIVIYKVDVDKNREIAEAFGISSIPAILYIPLNEDPVMTVGLRGKTKMKEEIDTILLGK